MFKRFPYLQYYTNKGLMKSNPIENNKLILTN